MGEKSGDILFDTALRDMLNEQTEADYAQASRWWLRLRFALTPSWDKRLRAAKDGEGAPQRCGRVSLRTAAATAAVAALLACACAAEMSYAQRVKAQLAQCYEAPAPAAICEHCGSAGLSLLDTVKSGSFYTGADRPCTHGHPDAIDQQESRSIVQRYRCEACGKLTEIKSNQTHWHCTA